MTRQVELNRQERKTVDINEGTLQTLVSAGQTPDSAVSAGQRCGAGTGNRTPDLFITSESLCRLSYPGLELGEV